MARYIDAERLLKVFEYWVSNNIKQKDHFTYKAVEAVIEAQPTVDVTEVVHGEWEECDWVQYDGHGECVHYPKMAVRCSNCCNVFKKELLWRDNYCPNCGAKMDGKKVK